MDGKVYSEAQVQEAIARQITIERLNAFDKRLSDGDRNTAADLSELKTQLSHVISMIEKQGTQEKESRKELKKEIESEFASKIDLERLENKLDKMWLKITMSTSAIIGAGVFIAWLLTAANNAKNLIGH